MIKVSNELMDNWNVILDEESIYNAYLSGDRHNSDCFLLSSTYFSDIQLNITNLQLINGVLYADINEVEGLPMNVERVNVEDGHLIAYYREGYGQMSRVDLGVVVGPKGDTGNTPNIRVGIVTTGNPGTDASVNITGTEEEPVLNFTIPRGNTGEVSEEELDSAVKSMASPVYNNASGDIVTFDDGAKDALIKSLLATINPVQSGSGDPSPDNIRPISGRTGLTVTRAGKNLLDPNDTNVTSTNIYFGRTTGVYLFTGITYTASYYGANNCDGIYVNKKSDGSQVHVTYNTKKNTFTVPETGYYIINYYNNGGITYDATHFQLETGTATTDYAPYAEQTYPITWQTEAGTVYGGTLDVVSGVLTVTHGYILLDGSQNISQNGRTAITQRAIVLIADKAFGDTNIQSNRFAVTSSIDAIGKMNGRLANTGVEFYLPLEGTENTKESCKQWFADNNTQLVYELATPQTYQLTPTEVRTILGGNTIYTDAGAVSVDYVADTGIYIDNSINKVKRLIAGIETTYVASRNYNVGDFIVVNNDLLKVISAIASGETIVIGTNANITTVAEQLILLFNS